MGGIGTTITGFLAEPKRPGVSASLMMLVMLPLFAAPYALALPRGRRRRKSQPAPIQEQQAATMTVNG